MCLPVSRAHVAGEILIRQEDDRVGLQRIHHGHRVARRAADVRFGLHVGVGVDVGDDRHAGKPLFQRADIRRGDALSQRAARLLRRQQHGLRRVQDFGRLAHEAHAAEDDDVLVGLRGLAAQLQRVADEIGDRVIERRLHVVVAQDHRVLLALQLIDLDRQLGFVA